MVTALRNLVDLYTFYFEILERFLDPLLDLLCYCIDQGASCAFLRRKRPFFGSPAFPSPTENDTLARIGTTCFQQLLESNVRKLSPAKWERIVSAFIQLFQTTLAHMLFDENLRSENELPDAPAYSNEPGEL
jgi:brefeldin A-inhibited guanine nucleotide-exchange protein